MVIVHDGNIGCGVVVLFSQYCLTAIQSKTEVCANIKRNRYLHETFDLKRNPAYDKRLYEYGTVDTDFNY